MFAVIKTGGKQYRTQAGDVLHIEKLDKKKGQKITFNEVLLIEDDGKAIIGTPLVKDASVKAVVLDNLKDKKIVIFKKKRRKRYKKKAGHRQSLTKIKIEEIAYGKRTSKEETQKPKQEKKSESEIEKKSGPEKTVKKKKPQEGSVKKQKKETQKSKQAKKTAASKKKSSDKKPKSRPVEKKKSSSGKKE